MIVAVLDTNVVVQAAIGSRQAASAKVVDALFEGHFFAATSPTGLEELRRVLSLPQLFALHRYPQDEIDTYIRAVMINAKIIVPTLAATYPVRDLTDRAFLALADAADADYLVTNDRRHLVSLKRFGGTKIVTPAAFLRHLK